jgi:hypothetical protein
MINIFSMIWFVHFNLMKTTDHFPKIYEILVNLMQKIKIPNVKKPETKIETINANERTIEIDSTKNNADDKKELEKINYFMFMVFSLIIFLTITLILGSP